MLVNPFEYVTILLSIILGLGIAQLLGSLAERLIHPSSTQFYWPQLLWVLVIFFLHIQDWFITYQLREMPSWNLPTLLFVLMYPVLLFMSARVLFPDKKGDQREDLKAHYYGVYRNLMVLVGLAAVFSVAFNCWLLHQPIADQWLIILFALLLGIIAFGKQQQEWIHKWLAVLMVVAAVASTLLERDVWTVQ